MSPFINHYRFINPTLRNEKNPKGITPKGGLTIAIIPTNEGLCRWGFSKCHRHDSFVKRTGRIRAIGRAMSKSAMISEGMDIKTMREKAELMAEFIIINRVMPDEQAMFESMLKYETIAG